LNKRETGTVYEAEAADYLIKNGVSILDQNYRIRSGEIDLIGRDGEYLVFFEVKYRRNNQMGEPLLAVTSRKQEQIRKVAKYYLYSHHYRTDVPVRFDCIGIMKDQIDWVKNCFTG